MQNWPQVIRRKIRLIALCLQLLTLGCAAQRPVLYPNGELNRVGMNAADRDIDDCMRRAEAYVRSDGQAAQTLEHAGVGAGTGAAIGAAAGGAGGAVVGRAGTGAAVGAAGGGAAGATRAVMHELFRKRDPSPVYKNFVNRCLREKGYEPIGWK
jgi:outer membrane lipoprotein SlyB